MSVRCIHRTEASHAHDCCFHNGRRFHFVAFLTHGQCRNGYRLLVDYVISVKLRSYRECYTTENQSLSDSGRFSLIPNYHYMSFAFRCVEVGRKVIARAIENDELVTWLKAVRLTFDMFVTKPFASAVLMKREPSSMTL